MQTINPLIFYRMVAEINPDRGNKRPTKSSEGRASTRTVHHVLAQFNEKYDEYFAEESDTDDEDME